MEISRQANWTLTNRQRLHGIAEHISLPLSLKLIRCRTGSRCRLRNGGPADVERLELQTTRAKLSGTRCSLYVLKPWCSFLLHVLSADIR